MIKEDIEFSRPWASVPWKPCMLLSSTMTKVMMPLAADVLPARSKKGVIHPNCYCAAYGEAPSTVAAPFILRTPASYIGTERYNRLDKHTDLAGNARRAIDVHGRARLLRPEFVRHAIRPGISCSPRVSSSNDPPCLSQTIKGG